MDQGAIANFKAHYLRRTFRQLFHVTDGLSQESIKQFWVNFNIRNAIENIDGVWEDITNISMNSTWQKLWPDVSHEFMGFEVQESFTREIIQFANQTGLN